MTHTTVRVRDSHADYEAAKSGDPAAAFRLVDGLLKEDAIEVVRRITGNGRPFVQAVSAIEANGYNAIPDAMAQILADRLGLEAGPDIDQINVVGHTRASGFHRIVFRPEFGGFVAPGHDYLIVDDHVGMGGTIAELRAFIEANGGRVIGATTLTKSRDSHQIALDDGTLDALRMKHGEDLEEFWQGKFGYGLDGLTRPEAGYLFRSPSLERIRTGIAEAES